MSELANRLAALFLAPEAPSPRPAREEAEGGAAPAPADAPAPVGARVQGPIPVGGIAVLGGPAAGPLAADLAAAVARRERRPCGLTLTWGADAAPAAHRPATRAAAALAATLGREPVGVAAASGAGVVVTLPADPEAAAGAVANAVTLAGPGVVPVLALCAPRPACFDVMLAEQALVVGLLGDDAPDGLRSLASLGLERAAPGARTRVLASPRTTLPRVVRHRSAIREILGAWDG